MYSINDAYESEISDFLMDSYQLREENTFLKHSLERLSDELQRHIITSQNENKALVSEITRLQNAIEQVKLLIENHEKELEQHHLRHKNTDQVRLEANLPIHTQSGVEPLYSITMEEYNSMKIRVQRAQEALDIQESNLHELTQYLHHFDEELTQRSIQLVNFNGDIGQEKNDQQKSSETLKKRLVKLLYVWNSMKLENAAIKALLNTGELEAFRVRRSTVIAIRQREPILLHVSDKALSVEDAALTPVNPTIIVSEPLFVATAEELLESRQCAVELSERLKLEESKRESLFHHLEEYKSKHTDILNQLEEAHMLLEEARCNAENAQQKEMFTMIMLSTKTTEYEDDKAALNERIFDLESSLEQQKEEIRTFWLKRFEAFKIRQKDCTLKCEYDIEEIDIDMLAPVQMSFLKYEPLFCVTLEEFDELRDANAVMVEKLAKMSSIIQNAFISSTNRLDVDKEEMLKLEDLLHELTDKRKKYEETQLLLTEKETELERVRIFFTTESEYRKEELIKAQTEVELLQQDLGVISSKMEDAMHIFGITDEVITEAMSNPERTIGAFVISNEAERGAAVQLETNENQFLHSQQILSSNSQNSSILDKINRMIVERTAKEAKLESIYLDLEQSRGELKAAKENTDSWVHKTMTLEMELDVVSRRTEDLVNELRKKTDQYNQVIRDLNDFAAKQSYKYEKELIQRLAACECELFEYQEIHKDETKKSETQISILQDQVNRLKHLLEHEGIVNDELCKEVSRLQKNLIDAREDMLKKLEEIDILKEEMLSMANIHKENIHEVDEALEKKNKEVSDALDKLEELTAMLQAAREGEKSALHILAESDAEVFRLQREIDILNRVQSISNTNTDTKMI
ncbi:unnamed protein product [Phytomonas sp. Hart1]|nr:unnamed protein product [Phytomonas sp. Hart1]|eukprot:CCW66528.1 unnamed protein product [Phytomonas sp. isolate Hart1]